MNIFIKIYYWLRGYSSFWQDKNTGRWYAYHPEHMEGYWSHEAERVPIPTFRELLTRQSDEITFAHQEAVEAGRALSRVLKERDRLSAKLIALTERNIRAGICPDCGNDKCMADGETGLWCPNCDGSYLLKSELDDIDPLEENRVQ